MFIVFEGEHPMVTHMIATLKAAQHNDIATKHARFSRVVGTISRKCMICEHDAVPCAAIRMVLLAKTAYNVISEVSLSRERRCQPFQQGCTFQRRCGQQLCLHQERDQYRERSNWQQLGPELMISCA